MQLNLKNDIAKLCFNLVFSIDCNIFMEKTDFKAKLNILLSNIYLVEHVF